MADFDLARRIFRERNTDGVAQAIAQQRADADGRCERVHPRCVGLPLFGRAVLGA